jgi:hypothetical protein
LSFGASKTSKFNGGQLPTREIFSAVGYRTAVRPKLPLPSVARLASSGLQSGRLLAMKFEAIHGDQSAVLSDLQLEL